MATSTYAVTGMTCEHGVRAVTEEVRRIQGVAAFGAILALVLAGAYAAAAAGRP